MPDFIQTAVKEIDDQLRALKDETSRLEAARAALAGPTRRRGRPSSNGTARTRARSASRRNGRSAAPRSRGGNTRANQTLELVREKPGITIPEIAKAMKIEPNYLYRLLPRLESNGQVKRDGQGWHPAASSTSTPAAPVDRARTQADPRRQAQAGAVGDSARADSARRRLEDGDATAGRLAARPSRRCSPRSPVVRR